MPSRSQRKKNAQRDRSPVPSASLTTELQVPHTPPTRDRLMQGLVTPASPVGSELFETLAPQPRRLAISSCLMWSQEGGSSTPSGATEAAIGQVRFSEPAASRPALKAPAPLRAAATMPGSPWSRTTEEATDELSLVGRKGRLSLASSSGDARPLSCVSTSAGPTPCLEEGGIPHRCFSTPVKDTPTPEDGDVMEDDEKFEKGGGSEAPPGSRSWLAGPAGGTMLKKVFVGGCPQDMDQDALFGVFSTIAPIKKAWLQRHTAKAGQAPSNFSHRGFGFVVFQDVKAVNELMQGRDAMDIIVNGSGGTFRLEVKRARTSGDLATDSTTSTTSTAPPRARTRGHAAPPPEVQAVPAQQQQQQQHQQQQQPPLQQFVPQVVGLGQPFVWMPQASCMPAHMLYNMPGLQMMQQSRSVTPLQVMTPTMVSMSPSPYSSQGLPVQHAPMAPSPVMYSMTPMGMAMPGMGMAGLQMQPHPSQLQQQMQQPQLLRQQSLTPPSLQPQQLQQPQAFDALFRTSSYSATASTSQVPGMPHMAFQQMATNWGFQVPSASASSVGHEPLDPRAAASSGAASPIDLETMQAMLARQVRAAMPGSSSSDHAEPTKEEQARLLREFAPDVYEE